MDTNGLLILKYQDNFADNMTSVAYGKILEKDSGRKCYFENITKSRKKFENEMFNFNIDYDFVSTARVEEITQKAFNLNNIFINEKKINSEISKKNTKNKNKVLDLKHFNIQDIAYISDDIKKMFAFKNTDFIENFDILENINTSGSIGLYISKKDIRKGNIDFKYIKNATVRLNKYIKKPKLFIFTDKTLGEKIESAIDFEILNLFDWREEFLFLKSCTHKILLSSPDSYSEGFWAAALSNKSYGINIYDKKINAKRKPINWIGV